MAGPGTDLGHLLEELFFLQQGGVVLDHLEIEVVVLHGVGNDPQRPLQLGQEIPPVELIGLAVEGQAALVGQAAVVGPVAQGLKLVDVQRADNIRIPGVGPPAGEDGLHIRAEQRLQHGPHPVEQGLEGVDRVGAVLPRPELLDELALGHIPVPVDQQIGEDVPQLLGTICLVCQYVTIHGDGKTAQHGDFYVFYTSGIAHDRHLLSSILFRAKKGWTESRLFLL